MSGLHKRREVVSSDGNTADCEEVRCGRSPGPYVTPAEDASVDILEAYAWRFIRVSKGVQFPCESGGVDKGSSHHLAQEPPANFKGGKEDMSPAPALQPPLENRMPHHLGLLQTAGSPPVLLTPYLEVRKHVQQQQHQQHALQQIEQAKPPQQQQAPPIKLMDNPTQRFSPDGRCLQRSSQFEDFSRSTYPSDRQRAPDNPLDQGWWRHAKLAQSASQEHLSLPLSHPHSSPQQQEWREDLYSKPSMRPGFPQSSCLAAAKADPTPYGAWPRPFSANTTHQVAARHSTRAGNISEVSAGQLMNLQAADNRRLAPLRSPRAPVQARSMHLTYILQHPKELPPTRAQSMVSYLFTGLGKWLKYQPQRFSSLRNCINGRHSNSSDVSLTPCGKDRWPGTITTCTDCTVPACTPASEQPCMQASVQAWAQQPMQATRSKHSMEGDSLALAHLTKRYSQEADSPAYQLASVPSYFRSSGSSGGSGSGGSSDGSSGSGGRIFGFHRAPTTHLFISEYSRGGRFSLSYSTAMVNHNMHHVALAASSSLYHIA